MKKGVLKNIVKFTGKRLCQSLFLIKLQASSYRNQSIDLHNKSMPGFYMRSPAILFKKKLWRRCFPVNVTKFLRIPILQNTSGRLLLDIENMYYG